MLLNSGYPPSLSVSTFRHFPPCSACLTRWFVHWCWCSFVFRLKTRGAVATSSKTRNKQKLFTKKGQRRQVKSHRQPSHHHLIRFVLRGNRPTRPRKCEVLGIKDLLWNGVSQLFKTVISSEILVRETLQKLLGSIPGALLGLKMTAQISSTSLLHGIA